MRTSCSARLLAAALVASLSLALASKAAVYDPASGFSATSNPAGVWSYGFSTTLGGPMALDPEIASDNGIDAWRTNIWLGAPAVFHNGTSNTITNSTGTLVMPPGSFGLHPGPGGQYSLLRFSAPADGSYQIAAAFSGLDIVGTTTDVHVLTNGTSIFDGLVNGYGPGPGYNSTVTLQAGDSIDFAVGWGANQEFSFDSTGLSAQITPATTPPACQPPPLGLVSWWRAQNNALDSVNSNDGLLSNGVAFAAGEVGQAVSFNGTDGYVQVPNSPSLNPPGSFSIEFWFYPNQDAVGEQQMLVGKWSDNGEFVNQRSYFVALESGRVLRFGIADYAHQWDIPFHIFDTASNAVALQAWNHVVVVYDQSTGTRRIFVNGLQAAERTDPPVSVLNSTAPLTFGGWVRGGGWFEGFFGGLMDEVSLYQRALTATEIQGLYLADSAGKCVSNPPPACVSPPAGLVSWWRTEGDFSDSADSNNGTPAGNVTFGPGRVGQALVFDGTSSAVRLGNPANLQLQVFTIEAWIKRASTSRVTFDTGGNAAGTFYSYGPGGYGFQIGTNGQLALGKISYGAVLSTAGGVTDTNWHHVAVSKNGSAVTFYLDGAFNSQVSYDPGFLLTTPVTIGAWPWGNGLGNCFLGSIDELAVYSRALGTNEIQAIYAADGAGKCPGLVAPAITTQPLGQSATVGSSISFNVAASGSQPLSYQWRLNGANLAGKTTNSLVLANIQLTNAGSYSVVVTNLAGTVTSSNAVLTVNPSSCVTPPAGMVNWWPADGNADDVTGGLNGALFGGTSFASGEVGQTFSFDGVKNCVTNTMPGLTNILNSYTMEFWAQPTAGRATTPEASVGITGTSSQRYAIYPAYGGLGTVGAGVSVGTNGISVFEHGYAYLSSLLVYDAPIAGWTHIAVVYVNKQPSLYVNGALVRTGLVSTRISCPSTFFGEGGAASGNYGYYAGLLDEVSIYNRPLSASEILAIYNAGGAGKCSMPVAPSISTQPASQVVSVGANVTFNVSASGTPPLSYQWRFNGANLTDKTTNSLTLVSVQLTNAGTYSVVVSNTAGSVTSSNAVLAVNPVVPGTYDAASGFSATSNPSGVWSYGYSRTLGSPMVLYPERLQVIAGLDVWRTNIWLGAPAVFHNSTSHTLTNNTEIISTNILGSHPGPNGEYSIARFSAPSAGQYHVAALFSGLDIQGTTTDVHILTNGVPLFNGTVNGFSAGSGPAFNAIVALSTGGYLDFAVGRGVDNDFSFDGTALSIQISPVPPPISCVAPPDGIVSWWRAESNALDSVDSNNGTLVGNATYGPGPVGQAFLFDGANDGVNLGSPANLQLQVFTIESWVKRASLLKVSLDPGGNAAGTFYSYGPGGYGFQIGTDGRLALGKISYGAVLSTAGGITDTNWHHVAVSKNGSAVTFYLDGTLNSRVAYDPGFVLTTPVTIGAWGTGLGNCFLGSIDELAVYNRALATNEIQALYLSGNTGKCTVPPFIVTQPAGQTLSKGSTATFAVTAGGNPVLRYQWLFNGSNIAGATGASLSRTNAQLADGGSYSVLVANAFGSVLSSNAVLSINGIPAITFQYLTHQQGTMRLQFVGAAGNQPLVQASTNLVDWETIGTATDLGNGSFEFEDANAASYPARFYRVVAP